MSNMKCALFLLLSACAAFTTRDVSAETSSCSVRTEVGKCQKNLTQYLEMPVTLENVMRIYSPSRAIAIDKRCSMFQNVSSCVNNNLIDCDLTLDPYESRWENAQLIMAFICNDEHKQDFASLQCPSTSPVRTEVLKCDEEDGTAHNRRKRHSCNDYREKVRCFDAVITKHCGVNDATLVGYITRVFLTGTPHTKDCKAPDLDVRSTAATAFSPVPRDVMLNAVALAVVAKRLAVW